MDSWETVELHGGPLDGYRTVVDPDDPRPWHRLPPADRPGGRSWYAPDEHGVWRWGGDTP
ncbi:hypothetical protein [Kitasatospora sp. NPDC127116]|uniref:hypothetical protein n=1 Tax=Kitasatospora sp. NPDC127116 TaxID=3345367 RepID=UPI00362EEBE4